MTSGYPELRIIIVKFTPDSRVSDVNERASSMPARTNMFTASCTSST